MPKVPFKTQQAAEKLWDVIKSNLTDRSVLSVDQVDDELEEEIDDEQVKAILVTIRGLET